MTTIDLQQIQRDELSKQIDKLIKIIFKNSIGNKCILVGYIRIVENDCVRFEHNDYMVHPRKLYPIRNIISFEVVKEKRKLTKSFN
jgi:hypothetical protein